MIKEIEQIFSDKQQMLKDYPHEMIASYGREIAVAKDYNGRQILELIQNCDDAGATEIKIEFNEDKGIVTISNNGEKAFSIEGYRSISIDSLSSKTNKRNYIGSKGLGFRAILNWANSIKVYSNDICLEFSEQNSHKVYDNLFTSQSIENILAERQILADIKPIPILCCPYIFETSNPYQSTTTIEIKYKNIFIDDIKSQLKDIQPEVLIFLNNTTEIDINIGDNLKNIKCKRNSDFVIVNNIKWDIHRTDGMLPQEINDGILLNSEFYEIKIAIQNNIDNYIQNRFPSCIYSFFPTKINVEHPYLLHATFELDISRNHINYSDANKYIVERVAELLNNIAMKKASENPRSWRAYDLIHVPKIQHNKELIELGLYEKLQKIKDNQKLYPCMDGKYHSLNDIKWINDNISTLISKSDTMSIFPNMLISGAEKRDIKQSCDYITDEETLKLNTLLKSIELRGDWIYELNLLCKNNNKYNLIIDKNDEIIACDNIVYTPATNKDIIIPNHCKIHIINKKLYDYLVHEKFQIKESDISRTFAEKLSLGYEKIRSYEPMQLMYSIIGTTNKNITSNRADNVSNLSTIKNTIIALFNNYKLSESHPPLDNKLLLPNKKSVFKRADELIFSDSYKIGKITKDIFSEIYEIDDYIIDYKELMSDNCEIEEEFEQFLKWLGITEFAQTEKKNKDKDFEKYKNIVAENEVARNITSLTVTDFKNINILNSISFVNFIIWTKNDNWIKRVVDSVLLPTEKDIIHYNYYGKKNKYTEDSYIKMSLKTHFKTNSIIIDSRYQWLNESIDLEEITKHKLILKHNIDTDYIYSVLKSLGAKQTINNLSMIEVRNLLTKIPDKYPDGRNTQSIYKDIYEYLKINNININDNIKLFAKNNNGLNLYMNSNIYYSEKMQLPKVLRDQYPTFNFPSRAGGADAVKRFGLKKLEDIKFIVNSQSINDSLTQQTNDRFNDYKPMILAARIEKINENNELENSSKVINTIKFVICNSLSFKVNDNPEIFELQDNEYLKYENKFYIKTSVSTSNKLLYGAVSEIVSLSYDVNTLKDIVFIILVSDSKEEARQYIELNYGNELLNKASKLLNISIPRERFINNLCKAKKIDWEERYIILEKLDNSDIDIEIDNITKDNIAKMQIVLNKIEITFAEYCNIDDKLSSKINQVNIVNCKTHIDSKNILTWALIREKCKKEGIKENLFDEIAKVQGILEKFLSKTIYEMKYDIDIDLEFIYVNFLKYLKLDNINQEIEWEEDTYNKNLSFFELQQRKEIEENNKIRSLLYYNLNENDKNRLKKQLNIKEETSTLIDDKADSNSAHEFLDNPTVIQKQNTQNDINNRYPTKAYNGAFHQRNKKQVGMNSENIVLNFLRTNNDKYKSIVHVSKSNDGLHYDIQYNCNNSGVVKYIEVKSFYNGCFELTHSELKFAKQHINNYEIWLVTDEKIIRLSNNQLFHSNGEFVLPLESLTYRVSIDLK